MWWFILTVSCFVLAFILAPKPKIENVNIQKDPDKYKNVKQDKKDCMLYKRIIHLGGHPSFNQEEKLVFKIRHNKVFIEDWFLNKSEELTFENLIDYKIQTETELRKNITIPRVLLLGIFSLASQKETRTTDQFLILKLKQNDVKFECVFGKNSDSDNLNEIITEINRLKIENAKNKNIAV